MWFSPEALTFTLPVVVQSKSLVLSLTGVCGESPVARVGGAVRAAHLGVCVGVWRGSGGGGGSERVSVYFIVKINTSSVCLGLSAFRSDTCTLL